MKNEVNRALVAKKKLTILFALLTLSVGLWAETVSYLYPVYKTDGVPTSGIKEWQSTTVDATEITNASATLAAGWYVVKGTNVQTGTLTCQGAVHIILADGAKLTATGRDSYVGIQVSGEGNSLIIYGQANQSGQLITTGGMNAAGIGGGVVKSGTNITINGGIVEATGGKQSAGIGGGIGGDGSDIIINGGTVTATGGDYAAGIGGGRIDGKIGGAGSNITINGGKVTATGGKNSAGIGGGVEGDGTNITINGGVVTATGGKNAAGIGGGQKGSGSNITITGGTITATGGVLAAGIGGGQKGSGSDITINGGVVSATGGEEGAGIGGGQEGNGSDITINGGTVTATGGDHTVGGGDGGGAGIGGGAVGAGSNITINGGTVTATGGDGGGAGIGGGNKGNGSNIFVATSLVVKADGNNPPTTVIATTRSDDTDIASSLVGKQYVIIKITESALSAYRAAAIAEIEDAIEDVTSEDILAIANKAKEDINNATTTEAVNNIKTQALADLKILVKVYNSGKAAAKAALPTDPEGTPGHTVTITKGEKTLKLVNPDFVEYDKQ